ncbi:hypothetical protein J8631_09730 [Serratia fonticola]|uniref:hypothetical protein n=1 Tax=Serratia fonticola TaxID=47917 RepID=UPI001AE956F8|nr:hypothetical protein [Serratia fonticola]MBP1035838.1 hypothetical protein [Serratia fonticola]
MTTVTTERLEDIASDVAMQGYASEEEQQAMARELLAVREAQSLSAGTQFKPVADLYEMQFEDGHTCAFHTDAGKAIQWLNTCDGNKVQEYVKLERLQEAFTAPPAPAMPDDTRRMDWLVAHHVEVRKPLLYGSEKFFTAQTLTDREDDYHATSLREQIDAAMAAAPTPTK